jgi:RNA polymerase sigma factor (sigma-70 family)
MTPTIWSWYPLAYNKCYSLVRSIKGNNKLFLEYLLLTRISHIWGHLMEAETFLRVDPFLTGLKHYCFKLAKNEWDAQDLLQEALTKIYRSIQQNPNREFNKAYLHRIVTNAWIDHCRRKQAVIVFDEEVHQSKSTTLNELLIRETFEQLAYRLNVRQMVLILMVDIFQFTALETAQLLHTNIGAVKEGLKRARNRLQKLAIQSREDNEQLIDNFDKKRQFKVGNNVPLHSLSKEVFEQFLSGFRTGDPMAICRTYLQLVDIGMYVEKVAISESRMYFTFRDPNGHLISFFQDL